MLSQSRGQPRYGLTLGMADLFQAREILVVVSGAAKQEPLGRLLSGRLTTEFPASCLVLHGSVSLFCDSAAASAAEHFQ
jgi:6-phosphogluconolactonase/glucosamine-6-phosphate isomerase/deaminase